MEWLLIVLAMCVLVEFFRRAHERRLAALRGPWIMENKIAAKSFHPLD